MLRNKSKINMVVSSKCEIIVSDCIWIPNETGGIVHVRPVFPVQIRNKSLWDNGRRRRFIEWTQDSSKWTLIVWEFRVHAHIHHQNDSPESRKFPVARMRHHKKQKFFIPHNGPQSSQLSTAKRTQSVWFIVSPHHSLTLLRHLWTSEPLHYTISCI